MTKKAIIFDMDGLMVDTEPISHSAWNEFLRPFNHQLTPDLIQQLVGLRADISSHLIQTHFDLPLTSQEVQAQKGAISARLFARDVPVMPGLFELMAELERRRLPWAVGTSSKRQHAITILQQLGLTEQCQAIAGGDEVKHGKPHPDIYLLAAKRLNIAPEHCLALEDSAPGSKAAVNAGMHVVAVPNADTKNSDFSHATAVCHSLEEVLNRLPEFLSL